MKETTKFANEPLEIPLQVMITVPYNYKPLKIKNDNNSPVFETIVSLLVVAAIVALVWKLKFYKKTKVVSNFYN